MPASAHSRIALPMRLVPGRGRTAVLLALSVAFVALGLWMAREQPLLGYLCAAFFALGIPVFALSLIPGSTYLELTEEGFTFQVLFRRKSERWKDIQGFGVWKARRHKRVGWIYVPGHRARGQGLAEAMSGVHGSLPDTYGMQAEELADLMTEIKRRT